MKIAFALGILIAAIIGYVYFPVFQFEYVSYDDGSFIGLFDGRDLDITRFFTSFYAFDYIPLFLLSLWGEKITFGVMDPSMSHFINVLLHIVNVMLLAYIIRKIFFPKWWPVVLAVVLFALHPLNVESIAWVTERKGLLSSFFTLLALIFYLWRLEKGRWYHYFLTVLMFVFAVLAKPVALFLPVLLILFDWMMWRKGKRARWWVEKLPLFAIMLVFSWVHIKARQADVALATGSFSIPELFLQLPRSMVFYVSKFVYPTGLSPFYSKSETHIGFSDVIFYLAFVGLYVFTIMRSKSLKRILHAGILWFVIVLLPQMKIVPYGLSFAFADRYFYLAGIGLILTTAAILDSLPSKLSGFFVVVAIIGTMGLSILTRNQLQYWQHSGTLWGRVVEVEPKNAVAWNNLGLYQLDVNETELAKSSFYKAIESDSHYEKPWVNLAYLYSHAGDLPAARSALEQALLRSPENKELAKALEQLKRQ